MTAQRLSARTIEERCNFVERAARELAVDPAAFESRALVTWLARQPWSGSTAHTYHMHLRAWHRWLREQAIREDDPMALIPAPKRPRGAPRPITTAGLARVLRRPLRRRTRAMVLLAALAGLRAHEIAKVRGEDIDLDTDQVWIVGKGNVTASIPLHPLLREMALVMPRRGCWFPTYGGPGRGVAPVHRQAVVQAVARALRGAGIEATCHQLRHWYGTTLLDAGVDLRTTQSLMRHQSVATTERYTAVRDRRRVNAVLRLDPFYDDAAEDDLAA